MKLPTEMTKPKTGDAARVTTLIYGQPKIGKSTFCAGAPGALFLATEPGLNHLSTFQIQIGSWDGEADGMLTALAEVAKGEHDFRTIVIDTVDIAYRHCEEYICRKLGIQHPSDAPYGKGSGSVNSEFTRVLTKLASLPYGLMLVSHARDRETQTRTGTVVRIGPTLPDGARKILTGFVDVILYADVDAYQDADGRTRYQRVIRTKPTNHYEAGDRTGRLPETMPLDYAAFVAALASGESHPEEAMPPAQRRDRVRKERAA